MKKLLVRFLALDAPGIQMITHPQTKNFKATLTCDETVNGEKGVGSRYLGAFSKVTRFFCNVQGLLIETRAALYPANPATRCICFNCPLRSPGGFQSDPGRRAFRLRSPAHPRG